METLAIIQARMGSSRLPGKILQDICGKPLIHRVIERLSKAKSLDGVLVATTTDASDDVFVEVLKASHPHLYVYRGSEFDVLDRFYHAALCHRPTYVVRVCGDCPLIDPDLIDEVVCGIKNTHSDYVSNRLQRTYPIGLDVEAFTWVALKQAWSQALLPYEREHVTPYFYDASDLFCVHSVTSMEEVAIYRWTVDTLEDLNLVRSMYEYFYPHDFFSWKEASEAMVKHPEWKALNEMVLQKSFKDVDIRQTLL